MKRIYFGNRLTPVLILACVLCAAAFMISWYQLGHDSGIKNWIEKPPADSAQIPLDKASFAAPNLATFNEILERPLFIEGRVPPAEPEQNQSASATKVTNLMLSLEGIAITPEKRVAVVRDLLNNILLRLDVGMEHNGWVVDSVNTDSATFKNGKQSQELTLEADGDGDLPRPVLRRKIPASVAGSPVTMKKIRRPHPPSAGGQQYRIPADNTGKLPMENSKEK